MTDGFGTLAVRAYTAAGALPIEGAAVRIKDSGGEVLYSLTTDRDGTTAPVSLPTPLKALSMTPGGVGLPYSLYDLEIDAEGYYSKQIRGVAVFPGVASLQIINLIPKDGEAEDYPRGNINVIIPRNNDLE